jgi:hypothetical protein
MRMKWWIVAAVPLALMLGCTDPRAASTDRQPTLATRPPHSATIPGSGDISGIFFGGTTSRYTLAGVVTISGPAEYKVPVGSDGKFHAKVRAGLYSVSGLSPRHPGRCQAPHPAAVEAGSAVTLDVICLEK